MEDSYHVLLIMKRLIWITAVMAAMAWAGTVSAQPLVLGIHPYRPHTELQQMFAPLADFLSQRTGRKVEVRIGESYQSHFNAIVHSQVDLAFIGPALFVQMTQRHDMPNLLARLEVNGHSTFTGKIITRQGSGIHAIEDLAQCHFAFGSSSSTMSHLVPRQIMFEAGIDVDDLAGHQFYSSHNNVALAVLAGDADAGAVKEAVFEKYRPKGIVSIATTPEISEHLFIAPVGADQALIDMLRRHLLSLTAESPETKPVLSPIKKTATALVTADNKDYQKLREILTALRNRGVVE